jgi:hypothetical protein
LASRISGREGRMKPDEFIQEIEDYYYPYDNDTVVEAVKNFISRFSENEIEKIYKAVLFEFSRSFKIAPDIKPIKDAVVKYKIGMSIYPEAKEIKEKRFSEALPDDWGAELDRVIGSKRLSISDALKDRFSSSDNIPREIHDPEIIQRREKNREKFLLQEDEE